MRYTSNPMPSLEIGKDVAAAPPSTRAPAAPKRRLLGLREAAALGTAALLQALLVCLSVLPGLPLAKIVGLDLLAPSLAGLAAGLSLLLAPALVLPADTLAGDTASARRWSWLARAGFSGAWQAAALAFFLLVASRTAALDDAALPRCMAVVAAGATTAVLLAGAFPRAYAGLAFFWAAGLPVFWYLANELYFAAATRPGGPEASAMQAWMDGSLRFSPVVAAVGALNGQLVSGGPFGWGACACFAGTAALAGALLLWKLGARPRTSSNSLS